MKGFCTASIAAAVTAAAGIATLGACSPVLDWREVRTDAAALTVWLPCKPQRRVRQVELDGTKVSMEMLSCRADGSTWGLTSTDMRDPARIAQALAALRKARGDNLGAAATRASIVEIGGHPATQLRVEGRDAAGHPVVEQSLIFASGTRVFHMAVIGREPGAEALEAFFGPLRVGLSIPP